MFFQRILFCFLLLHLINCQVQINLYLTDWENEDDNFQHDCLYVPVSNKNGSDFRQIISYCMSEWPSKFKIEDNNIDQKLSFIELSKQNITSQQLYLWSTPIDIIEEYQDYLDKIQKGEETKLSRKIYYNCTLPYFGSRCQYVLNDYKSHHSSLNEIIYNYYYYNRYKPTLFTCYIHLECNRGPFPSCLDWTEICDGKVNCIGDGYDEEYCWQLEIQECNDNEYQCNDGQCIPMSFNRDEPNIPDCLDKSDEPIRDRYHLYENNNYMDEPTFRSEDTSCVQTSRIVLRMLFPSNVLSSSCIRERQTLLSEAMFSIKPQGISAECWTAMKCMINMPIKDDSLYLTLCTRPTYNKIIKEMCPDTINLPAFPLFFGHVYLVYDKNIFLNKIRHQAEPTFICYNHKRLHVLSDNERIQLSDNNTCLFYNHSKNTNVIRSTGWIESHIYILYKWLQSKITSIYANSALSLNRSTIYICLDWPKYISKRRLFDVFQDCYYRDDEDFDISYVRNKISFQTVCDGYTHLVSKLIDGDNETDETNCEQWPLIHIYNRCDGLWHVPDGSDELNCHLTPFFNCPIDQHICISLEINELMCLSTEKINNGIIDCLGAIDEPTLCPLHFIQVHAAQFYCKRNNSIVCLEGNYLCDNNINCDNNEDEQVCTTDELSKVSYYHGICEKEHELYRSNITEVLCKLFYNDDMRWRIYFTLDQRKQYLYNQNRQDKQTDVLPQQSINQTIEYYQPRCHRGFNVQIWLDKTKNHTRNICFCPPSYYGDICQYQNQRISLTLKFRVKSDSVEIPFIIIISLIDNSNERIIHSSEQLTYLSIKHCQKKFNIYLLYSTRPKNSMTEYFIHIDFYEKMTLEYRGSIIKSLNFSFLPVHRLAFQIDIPPVNENIYNCLDNQCINGRCTYYTSNETFCQCKYGWSGRYCTIKHNCTCSSDSICLGQLGNNRSLCICPMNKIGSRCLIDNMICRNEQNQTCLNKGRCIPIDEYETLEKKFVCICRNGFTGDRCEIPQTKLTMIFDENIILPSLIFIHFIQVQDMDIPIRTTTFKTISITQNSIIVYWPLPFHIIFVELSNKTYYLVSMKYIYNQSSIIEKKLNSSDRCLHINQLFNKSISNSSLRRRIKSYHVPCQSKSLELSCFYDEVHLCLYQQLDQQRVSNCFEFNHNMSLNCDGHSGCLNGGDCFQENSPCPKLPICQCRDCYFGRRCHLDTTGFSLSLDAILSYHVQPNTKISEQSYIVLISFIITLLITFLGIINGILCLITFKNKSTRESGCGIYLLCSSIIIFLIMISFIFKFLIFLFSQMGLITNRLFLSIQCYSIDFILRFSLTMDQWLMAFVAIERAFIIIKGLHFNRKKSILMAKWIIIGVLIFSILTNIHDPIYRSLFEENDDEDNDQKRIWCIVKYPKMIRVQNLIVNILNFILPFIINIISALIICIISARQQAKIQTQQKYNHIFKKQIQEHKNLLIGPCVLIILGFPRLIISLTSGCMKSSNDPWLFLLGYFISLIPSLLTFILFVLPSTKYKQAFKTAISNYRHIINRHS